MWRSQNTKYEADPGRKLSQEEIEKLAHLYQWPRPTPKFCRVETTNDRWRLGRF
jgi:hypothetical protein